MEKRNKLAGCLFEVVWIKDKKVITVTPRPEFKPFFQLSYEECLKSSRCDPGGIRTPALHRDRVAC